MKEKYFYIKRIHPDRMIILKTKNQYITFGQDLEIVKYFKLRKLFQKLENLDISYMILDKDLTILKQNLAKKNNYRYLLKKLFIIKVLRGDYCE